MLAVPLAQAQQSNPLGFLFFPLLIFVIFYFLLIMPQRRRQKKLQELVNNLKRGDMVVTNGGILGRVVRADDHTVTLTVASNVEVKFTKSAVVGLAREDEGAS
jgi:preprotein translocase subunit YajC